MIDIFIYGIIGLFAGLHSACWGLYKDSLYEKVTILKFSRSIFFSLFIAVAIYFLFQFLNIEVINLGIFFAVCVIIERFTTEIYKGFFRKEPQKKYKIPSYFHLGKHIVKNMLLKRSIGILIFISFFVLFVLLNNPLLNSFGNSTLIGMSLGLIMGTLEAIGGAGKDAPFEGLEVLKMFRSPFVHMLWGGLFSFFIKNYALIFLASGGGGRMTIEFYKSFITKKTPGKFKATKPIYREWISKRKIFIIPYITTWIIFFILLFLA